MSAPLNKGLLVRESWGLTRRNLGFLIGMMLLCYSGAIVQELLRPLLGTSMGGLMADMLLYLATMTVDFLLFLGFYRILLNLVRGVPVDWRQIGSETGKFWSAGTASLLVGLIVVGGLILLVVPGIVWALRYSQVMYLVIDEGVSPVEALRRSAQLTQGHKWDLFLLWWIALGLIVAGALAFGIGLLVAFPLVFVLSVRTYQSLREQETAPM